ncbi:MAG: tryptophan synthase subunit alpha, partial [Chitinispirillaceae bacterium]|nr:tryptophan synthase subunit alpha [Chitinispirillaceae bacterium]
FCREAAKVGIDSLLIADMPPEEYGEIETEMNNYKIDRVFIVSELTPLKRMRLISSKTDAFIYVISRLGTTGTGKKVNEGVFNTIKELKSVTNKPIAVGFGISKPEHVKEVISCGADGAIVGSALVEIIEKNLDKKKELPELLVKKIQQFKSGTIRIKD